MQQSSDIADSGITIHARVQDYDCVHTVFTLPLGNCILILTLATFWAYVTKVVDLKLIMGILEKKKISARFMQRIAKEALSSANLIEWELVRRA
ncbi:hypothetical protein Pyn_21631 [Prunus yedoensis var. nudiflora]|uniref:Uncharacterized protein n=1 Tax=Prunus yedoensis var. nudiflora TaxID=2094558 RepID=A0A314YIC0_PRUYE|nr:hypothetical protein Pyn_21631 [Prunus yedoensis var. nudiflora]